MKIGFFGLNEQEKKDYFLHYLTGHEVKFIDQNLSEDDLPAENDFEIISIFVQSIMTSKVIDHFQRLKMVAIRSTGFDNVDVDYAKERNIIVSNVPAYGSHTVAEFTFGLILSLSRKIPQAMEKVKEEIEFDHQGLRGFDLFGKTLGVIGTGKIGVNVVKIAKGFGMNVLAFDLYPNVNLTQEFDCHYVPLEQLLQQSDIVTIHVPASEKTHHLINKDNIHKMKRGSLLINTARGDVVQTDAIYKAISEGYLEGAGLDVIEAETKLTEDLTKEEFEPKVMKNLLEASYLIKNPKVIVTPHTAFYTIEAEQAIMHTTVENIQGFIQGLPKNVVKK